MLRALATTQSFERWSMVSDVVWYPLLQFVSAGAGTDAMETPCVSQLTEMMTRLQKIDYYYATISHK